VGLALACAAALAGSATGPAAGGVRAARDASADLSISVNHLPEPAKAWDVVGFVLTVHNKSDALATDVTVVVDPPPSEYITGCITPGGPGQQIYCPVGDVPGNQSRTVTLSLRVKPDATSLGATVNYLPDPDPSNNTTTDPIIIQPRESDLSIDLHGIPNPALAGSDLTVEAVITNGGPDDAYSPPDGSGVVAEITLPTQLEILSVSPGPGVTPPFCTNTYSTDQKITCRFPTLIRDQSKAIDIGDFVSDDRRFRGLTGWAPRTGLDDGLTRSLDYYRRHLASYV